MRRRLTPVACGLVVATKGFVARRETVGGVTFGRELHASPRFGGSVSSEEEVGTRGRVGVVKLLRARGGCLGVIRSERGRLRNVRGSCLTNVDPGMLANTRGTETSKYPQEKKSTETPSVAASERGQA